MRARSGTIVLLAALALAAMVPGATAQEAQRVLLLPSADESLQDASLAEIIDDSLALQLSRRGYSTADLDGEAPEPTDTESLRQAAGRAGAAYVLTCSYSSDGEELAMRFRVLDVAAEQWSPPASAEGKIGLTLDWTINEGLGRALNVAGLPQVVRSHSSGAPRAAAGAAPGPTGTPGTGDGAFANTSFSPVHNLPGASTPPAEEPPAEGNTRVQPRPAEPQVPSRPARRTRFQVASGFAPFIAAGEATSYFTLGTMTQLSFNFRIDMGAGQLGIGGFAGLGLFRTQGIVAAADDYLVPLGGELRYVLDGVLGVFVHAGGGAAVLVVDTAAGEPVAKPVPYALGGLGLTLPFSRFLGLSLDLSYGAFFEGSVIIMGFVPAAQLYVSL